MEKTKNITFIETLENNQKGIDFFITQQFILSINKRETKGSINKRDNNKNNILKPKVHRYQKKKKIVQQTENRQPIFQEPILIQILAFQKRERVIHENLKKK